MTHHILLASEQLWPNLLGLCALIERDGGIKSLRILHTGDQRRSADPAVRIAKIASKLQPEIKPLLIPTGVTSQEIIGVVHSIFQEAEERPDNTRWSINATGGTKTMFAGLVPWVRRPNVEAFYREVTGIWFHLIPLEINALQLLTCEEWHEAAFARLSLPVSELATIQTAHPQGATWQSQPPPTLDIPKLLQTGIDTGWDWSRLQKQFPELGSGQSGFAFELFFGSLLKACGVSNVTLNLEMSHENLKRQEFDVLASTGEKLILFDLKLTEADSEATINQISRIGEDRRSLGGLNAIAVAIRPSWQSDPVIDAIARSHHVEVWTQEDMASLIKKIQGLLDVPVQPQNPKLLEAEKVLVTAAEHGNRLFVRSNFLPRFQIRLEQRIGMLNLNAYWTECLRMGNRAMALDLGGRFLLRYSLADWPWRSGFELDQQLPKDVVLEWFHRGKTSTTALAIIACRPESVTRLRQFLERMIGSSVTQAASELDA